MEGVQCLVVVGLYPGVVAFVEESRAVTEPDGLRRSVQHFLRKVWLRVAFRVDGDTGPPGALDHPVALLHLLLTNFHVHIPIIFLVSPSMTSQRLTWYRVHLGLGKWQQLLVTKSRVLNSLGNIPRARYFLLDVLTGVVTWNVARIKYRLRLSTSWLLTRVCSSLVITRVGRSIATRSNAGKIVPRASIYRLLHSWGGSIRPSKRTTPSAGCHASDTLRWSLLFRDTGAAVTLGVGRTWTHRTLSAGILFLTKFWWFLVANLRFSLLRWPLLALFLFPRAPMNHNHLTLIICQRLDPTNMLRLILDRPSGWIDCNINLLLSKQWVTMLFWVGW